MFEESVVKSPKRNANITRNRRQSHSAQVLPRWIVYPYCTSCSYLCMMIVKA